MNQYYIRNLSLVYFNRYSFNRLTNTEVQTKELITCYFQLENVENKEAKSEYIIKEVNNENNTTTSQ